MPYPPDPTRATSDERTRLVEIETREFPIYGQAMAPASLSDLTLILNQLGFVASGWRGQANIQWPLDSSLVRRVRNAPRAAVLDNAVVLENVVREAEARLLERARGIGLGRRDGRDLADLELLALLQHHGAATRLVDCTRNFFVAAWFAAKDCVKDWGLVAGFDLSEAIHIDRKSYVDMPIERLLDDVLGDNAGWWQPSSLSPRMSAQQGFFVLSRATEEPWGSVALKGEVFADTGNVPGLPLVAISPALKTELNDLWDELFGYSDETMFPDLDGFAAAHGAQRSWPPRFFDGVSLSTPVDA